MYPIWFLFYNKSIDGLKNTIKYKFISLLVSYICFSIVTILWHVVLVFGLGCDKISDTYFGISVIYRDVFCFISGIGIGTLWFLPVLFTVYLLTALYIKYIHNNLKPLYSALLFIFLFFVINIFSNYIQGFSEKIELYGGVYSILGKYLFMTHRILYGLAYSLLGYFIGKLKNNYKHYIYIGIGAFIIALLSYVLNIYHLFNAFTCIYFFIFSLKIFDNSKPEKSKKILTPVIFCGKHSLLIMIYHYIILLPLEMMILEKISIYSKLENDLQCWLLFVINLLTTIILVIVSNKLKIIRFFMGKSLKN